MTHTIGSHSDDRGGESDFPCYCDAEVDYFAVAQDGSANTEPLRKLAQSNSKSEDTQDFTPDEAVVCTKCGYGEWRHDSLKHPCNVFEPPQDTSLDDKLTKLVEMYATVDAEKIVPQIKALFKAERAKIFEQIRSEVNSMYELSITDLELRQHQQGVEIPVLDKTGLLEALTRLEQK